MGIYRKKGQREKDLTSKYLMGDIDEDRLVAEEHFSARTGAMAQQRKIEKTTLMRAAEEEASGVVVEALPLGNVIQVFSLFYEVEADDGLHLCVLRKTLSKTQESPVVVGDQVRFRDIGI